MVNENAPLETYCADPECSPERPCADCLTVPVPRQTMAALVYGPDNWDATNGVDDRDHGDWS